MTEQKLKERKEEIKYGIDLLEMDIDDLQNMIDYVNEHIDSVDTETMGDFQRHIDEFVNNLRIVRL